MDMEPRLELTGMETWSWDRWDPRTSAIGHAAPGWPLCRGIGTLKVALCFHKSMAIVVPAKAGLLKMPSSASNCCCPKVAQAPRRPAWGREFSTDVLNTLGIQPRHV